MNLAEMRLEALKLAVRPHLGTEDIIRTAEVYFAFIGLDMDEKGIAQVEYPDDQDKTKAPRGIAAKIKAANKEREAAPA